MADAIILSQDMFNRMKKMLDDYESGYQGSIKLGVGLRIEEQSRGYLKIGIDGIDCSGSNVNV